MDVFTVSKTRFSRFQTIADAIDAAQPGSKVIIEPGVYKESITITDDIELIGSEADQDIIIESDQAIVMRIEAGNAVISNLIIKGYGAQNQYGIYVDKGSSVIKNCTVISSTSCLGVMQEGAAPIFENCSFEQGRVGIVSFYGASFTIKNSTVTQNSEQGIKISNNSNPTILNTNIKENQIGVMIDINGKGVIEGCEIIDNKIAVVSINRAVPIFSQCSISQNKKAIDIAHHSICILHQCTITCNSIGVDVMGSSCFNVFNSQIKENGSYDIKTENGTIQLQESYLSEKFYQEYSNPQGDKIYRTIEPSNHSTDNETTSTIEHMTLQEPEHPESIHDLLSELNSFIGLNQVKNKISELIQLIEYTKERKAAGIHTESNMTFHSIFLGKPGTGKTSIARLLSRIFFALGMIEKGHLVEVDRADLVGEYIGQTAQKTEKVINSAIGGVLFIDEAYTLAKPETQNDFGKEAIELILKRMEDEQNFIVIAAGYPEEMKAFVNSNPGLKDRFTHSIHFEDYNPDQLLQILEKMCKEEEYFIAPDAAARLNVEFIELFRERDQSFGNARMIRKVFDELKIKHAKRCMSLQAEEKTKELLTKLTLADVESVLIKNTTEAISIPINEKKLAKLLSELNKLTGLEQVKKEVNEVVALVRYYQEEGEDLSKKLIPHTVFLGNPGTGKTTVARLLSEIYATLGILPKGHLVEATRETLVSGYIGQTALKTAQIIDEAIGGTLFIDEAYTLVKDQRMNDFGQEAIDTILKRMEDERGNFIVIAAGYTEEMQRFLLSNPGLNSRFGRKIIFEDFSPESLMEITLKMIKNERFSVDVDVKQELLNYFEVLYSERDNYFSNARFVRNLVNEAVKNATLRLAKMPFEERSKNRKMTLWDFELNKQENIY